jgi:hypothetical protein
MLAPLLTLLAWIPLVARHAAEDARENSPDRVELRDGSVVEGRVLLDAGERVLVQVGSKTHEIARDKIQSVRSAAGSLRELLAQWERIAPDDAQAVLDLARFAEARGLAGEKELFAHLVLTLDAQNAAAHELLGHDAKGDDWVVRDGARRTPWKKLAALRRDFKSPWELATTHYALSTNLDLASACRVLLELESFYGLYQDTLAKPLELHEVTERMPVSVHADQESFPEMVGGGTAWFSPGTNTAAALFLTGFKPEILLEVATLQLGWFVCGKGAGKGSLPDWLEVGLSVFFPCMRTGEPGRPHYDPALYFPAHFRTHAETKKPYDASRVLGFAAGDFASTSRSDLKYAQCYTLLHFAWNGDGGAHRAGFQHYLGLAFAGKATSSSFEQALDLKERALEKAWAAHVTALARTK